MARVNCFLCNQVEAIAAKSGQAVFGFEGHLYIGEDYPELFPAEGERIVSDPTAEELDTARKRLEGK